MEDNKTKDDRTLFFKDLVILKQFIEKGNRENFFNSQEKNYANILHNKLKNIISDFMDKNNKQTTIV